MDELRLLFILALIGFVISGRKFLDSWRVEGEKSRSRRLLFGGICLACFVAMGFFELPI